EHRVPLMSNWNWRVSIARTAKKRKRPRAMRSESSTRQKTRSAAANAASQPARISKAGSGSSRRWGARPRPGTSPSARAWWGRAKLGGDDAAERRPLTFRQMLLRVPEIGADQRLAAMEIDFFGGDQDAAARRLAVDGKRFEQGRVRRDAVLAVDPQGLVHARQEEDQPHAGPR